MSRLLRAVRLVLLDVVRWSMETVAGLLLPPVVAERFRLHREACAEVERAMPDGWDEAAVQPELLRAVRQAEERMAQAWDLTAPADFVAAVEGWRDASIEAFLAERARARRLSRACR